MGRWVYIDELFTIFISFMPPPPHIWLKITAYTLRQKPAFGCNFYIKCSVGKWKMWVMQYLAPSAFNIGWQTSDREEKFQSGSPSRSRRQKASSDEATWFLMLIGTSHCLNVLLRFSQPARPPWGPDLVPNLPLSCRVSLCLWNVLNLKDMNYF